MNKTEKELNDILDEIMDDIFQEIGRKLKTTKNINATGFNQLTNMKKYGYDIEAINTKLKEMSVEANIKFEELFDETLQANAIREKDIARYKAMKKDIPLINDQIKTIKKLTQETLFNISNTTALMVIDSKGKMVHFGDYYKQIIDKAVISNTQGISNWNKEIKKTIHELGSSGLRIEYESGYTRRLDSAVRQNILGGISDVNAEMQRTIGKKWGSDGVEITAHALCAEDHLEVQGKQYTNEEYEEVQNKLPRQIGQWNCGHSAIPIFIGIDKPIYTKEELKQFRDSSLKEVEINGKVRTRYQWSQEMRKLECRIRDARIELATAKGLGDQVVIKECRDNLRAIRKQYNDISNIANISKRL